jgi:hypothetical protein
MTWDFVETLCSGKQVDSRRGHAKMNKEMVNLGVEMVHL